jgi:2-iminobutanoate/2-iminopropanoate deaminase
MTQQITFGPYSPIRKVGNLFFVSGQVGVDPTTKTASPDVSVQVEQALINLRTVLRSADLELNDVVKTTLFLTDMGDFATVNTTYLQFFNEPRPARSTVTVAELPRLTDTPLKFEIEAIATKEEREIET